MRLFSVKELSDLKEDTEVLLHGWVQETRTTKNLIFVVFRDHTGLAQLTIRRDSWNGIEVDNIPRESAISVSGTFMVHGKSKTGPEIFPSKITILNIAGSPLPLAVSDPVNSDIETRLNNRFLDLRKREVGIIFRVESDLLWGIRKHMSQNGFTEVHTPKIVGTSTEGGSDLFAVRYFEKEAFLNQSPQLYKEILVSSGVNRVFEVGPAFRAEKHNTVRHLNEFTSIDIEMAFSDHNDAMVMLENAVRSGILEVSAGEREVKEALGVEVKVPEVPFPRITFEECVDYLSSKGMAHRDGEDFSPDELRIIGERFTGFYFITRWPASLRPFYTMPDPDDSNYTNSFDLQFRENEITSGAQRVHDPEMLRNRFLAKGLNPDDFSFYLEAFRYGMPPHAGWGLGLERLTMIVLGLKNIREATVFPRDRNRISP